MEDIPVPADDLLGGVAGHVEEAGAGVEDGVARAGGVRHHERLLERRQRGAKLLRHPGERLAAGGGGPLPLLEGALAAAAPGGAGRDALGAARVLVGVWSTRPHSAARCVALPTASCSCSCSWTS